MKKYIRYLAGVLCLCLLAGLLGCGKPEPTDPTQVPPENTPEVREPEYDQSTNTWTLFAAEHLLLLAEHPDANFIIGAEIDCKGMVWTPVPEFTGTVSGVWGGVFNHTISNLVIEGKAGDTAVGLFGTLTGTITDINFANCTVKLPEGFSGNAGLIAGTVKTDLIDIEVSGLTFQAAGSNVKLGGLAGELQGEANECEITDSAITGTLTGGENTVGGFVAQTGKDIADVTVGVNITLTVSGSGAVGGIAGHISAGTTKNVEYMGKFKLSAGDGEYAAAPLVGKLEGRLLRGNNSAREVNTTGTKLTTGDYCGIVSGSGKAEDCRTRDLTNVIAYENASQLEKELRQKVVDYMYAECTMPWIPSWDMHYEDVCGGNRNHVQDFKAGETYFGLPYMHMCGSLERMQYWMNPDGTIRDDLPMKDTCFTGYSSPYASWDYYLGNDCADAVFWAWQQVSESVSYYLTADMVTQLRDGNGLVKVGSYTIPANAKKTSEIITANTRIFEAYMQLKPGDGVLYGPGHAMLVADLPYIFYKENGKIDLDRSYVLCHEQGHSTSNVHIRHSTCGVYIKYSFSSLLSTNYVPITVPELANVTVVPVTGSHTVTGTTMEDLWKGEVTTNYVINSVEVVVQDAQGNVIASTMIHPIASTTHFYSYPMSSLKNRMDLTGLKSGQTYHCTVTVQAGSETVKVIDGDFTA